MPTIDPNYIIICNAGKEFTEALVEDNGHYITTVLKISWDYDTKRN